jgi:hypothetical protein
MASSAQPTIEALAQSGVAALRQGDAAAARAAFDRVVASGRATPQLWLLLAQSCEALHDYAAASGALDQVLAADHLNLYALTMKGDVLSKLGDDRAATAFYGQAVRVARDAGTLPPDLAARVQRAAEAKAATDARFEAHLDQALGAAGVDRAKVPGRFAEALDIMSGRRQPYFQEPKSFFYPGLPHIAFYEPSDFPWLTEIAAMADAIRAEVEAVLADERGIVPYVEKPKDRPVRPHSLLDDARWSAFHLWERGAPVAAHAARCPVTMQALEKAPIPRIRGRSPMALFSILKPGTHIEPHNGFLNTRLICHIPLIVPDGCRLRVGNETRTVRAGEPLLFDDSIEHEAWNDGDSARAILLFEVWRPELSAAERQALTAMFDAIGGYGEA